MLGIRLTNNFETPYLSTSVSEFWRRWHISLSSWFRDYLYIPLGGNRKGPVRKNINLMIVFLTSGLWHGASWHFVVWGGLNGLYQIIGSALRPVWNRVWNLLHLNKSNPIRRLWSTAITFLLILSTWVFFRAETVPEAFEILSKSIHIGTWTLKNIFDLGLTLPDLAALIIAALILVTGSLLTYNNISIEQHIVKLNPWLRASLYFVLLWIILIFGIYGSSYDASSFLYFQF